MIDMVDLAHKVCGINNNDEEVKQLEIQIRKNFMTLPNCMPWSISDFIINDLKYRKLLKSPNAD